MFVSEVLECAEPTLRAELSGHELIRQLSRDLPPVLAENKPPDIQPFVPPDFSEYTLNGIEN